jgi:hypothetical protein
METLIINKGSYFLEKQTKKGILKIKLTVDYFNKRYNWKWLQKDYAGKDEQNLVEYVDGFAKRMIESKSHRNFFESTKK